MNHRKPQFTIINFFAEAADNKHPLSVPLATTAKPNITAIKNKLTKSILLVAATTNTH